MDPTWPEQNAVHPESSISARERLRDLRAALRLIAGPQVDAAFGGKIVAANAEAAAVIAATSDLAHDSKKPARSIFMILTDTVWAFTAEQRIAIAAPMAKALENRLSGNAILASLVPGEAVAQSLREEARHAIRTRNATNWTTLDGLIWSELTDVLIRQRLSNHKLDPSLFAPHGVSGIEFIASVSAREKFREAVLEPVGTMPLIATGISRGINQEGNTEGLTDLGLRLLISEMIENFVKYERIDPINPFKVGIRADFQEGIEGGIGYCDAYLSLGPVSNFPRKVTGRHAGLLSLESVAQKLGIELSTEQLDARPGGRLPFWHFQSGMAVWTIKNLMVALP